MKFGKQLDYRPKKSWLDRGSDPKHILDILSYLGLYYIYMTLIDLEGHFTH